MNEKLEKTTTFIKNVNFSALFGYKTDVCRHFEFLVYYLSRFVAFSQICASVISWGCGLSFISALDGCEFTENVQQNDASHVGN